MKDAEVRIYVDADLGGLARILAGLRSDVTYPGDPGAVVKRRRRPPCAITSPATPDSEWIPLVSRHGWLVVTRDARIQEHRAEVHAVREHGCRMVDLPSRPRTISLCVRSVSEGAWGGPMKPVESHVGRRVREIRSYRGLSLTACAGLAGMSKGNLSKIERGLQPVERRRTLEALAAALRVAPSDLTGQPFPAMNEREAVGHAAVEEVRAVLRDIEIGAVEAVPVDVAELRLRVDRAAMLSLACEYDALGAVLPDVLRDVWSGSRAGRDETRRLLIECLFHAFYLVKDMGYRDVCWSISAHLLRVAEETDHPAWVAIAEYMRAEAMTGADARRRALALVQDTADGIAPDAGPAGEAYGMLRLSAALQSAAGGAVSDVRPLLDEAADVARHTGEGNFGGMHFGPRNVQVWRVAMAVEVGDIDLVPELARDVDVEALPLGRRAWLLMDVGRGLALTRGKEAQAVDVLASAETLAPQLVHGNSYVRETVTDLLRRGPRDSAGRELRGMAYRMGLAG